MYVHLLIAPRTLKHFTISYTVTAFSRHLQVHIFTLFPLYNFEKSLNPNEYYKGKYDKSNNGNQFVYVLYFTVHISIKANTCHGI